MVTPGERSKLLRGDEEAAYFYDFYYADTRG